MEEFDSDDTEKPIEEYPGLIGMTMDWDFHPQDELRHLAGIDWHRYWSLLEFAPDDHAIEVRLQSGARRIRCTYGISIAEILDQIPSVKVFHAPGGQSMGGAAIYLFFIADGVSLQELDHDVRGLEAALQSDLRTLEARHGPELDA
jgi:hypothetical protein